MQPLCVPLSACGLYLYLALHANGSCETSQTFFPTVTFHQSGRGTRGPREDGSWSAPSHWLFGSSSWRPMARGPGSGQSQGNRLQPSIITPFTSEHWAPPPAADRSGAIYPAHKLNNSSSSSSSGSSSGSNICSSSNNSNNNN